MKGGTTNGGLGSSHTTPFGAAVPARPPTRSSDSKDSFLLPQWVAGATKRGTQVVVQRDYPTVARTSTSGIKQLIINSIQIQGERG